jgi:hypothetical protein
MEDDEAKGWEVQSFKSFCFRKFVFASLFSQVCFRKFVLANRLEEAGKEVVDETEEGGHCDRHQCRKHRHS